MTSVPLSEPTEFSLGKETLISLPLLPLPQTADMKKKDGRMKAQKEKEERQTEEGKERKGY